MNYRCFLRAVVACAAGLTVTFLSGVASASGDIQHNPFARPSVEELNATTSARASRLDEVWRPQLRAVLVAGSRSVADLGGVILNIGQSTNGYRLISVREEAATFVRNGEQVVLSLYDSESGEEQ